MWLITSCTAVAVQCSTSLSRMVDNYYQSVVLPEPRVQHKAVQVKWFKPLWPQDLWIFPRVDRQDCVFPPNNVRTVPSSAVVCIWPMKISNHHWLCCSPAAEKYLTLAGQSHYLWRIEEAFAKLWFKRFSFYISIFCYFGYFLWFLFLYFWWWLRFPLIWKWVFQVQQTKEIIEEN